MYRIVKNHSVLVLSGLKTIRVLGLVGMGVFSANAALAAEDLPDNSENQIQFPAPVSSSNNEEPAYTGWSFNTDNDLFTGGSRDQDYTGGIALAVTGKGTRNWLFSLDNARELLTRLSGFDNLYKDEQQIAQYTIEFGFTLFTPSNILIPEPIQGDHPYASLFFVANAAQFVVPERKLTYQSVLTIGALGLPIADSIQSGIHSATGSDEPEGWDNQVSEGGEPTARYSLSVQKTLVEGGGPGLSTQFSINSEANIGFTTDASVGFGARFGFLRRPWYTFNPHPAEYISIGTAPNNNQPRSGDREMFLYAGVNVKFRLYNAILQGQFRDSAVSYDYDELNPVVAEGWAGFLTEVTSGYRFGMFVRGRTAEIDIGDARSPVWAGLLLSRSL